MNISDHLEARIKAQELSNAQLGALIREYITESEHGGWEGFNQQDLRGVNAFIIDMLIYHDLCREDEGVMERKDEDIDYVDETIQEYANLRHDAGEDWTTETQRARAHFLMYGDAIRCAIDPAELRRLMEQNEAQLDAYMEQAGAASDDANKEMAK